MKLDTKLQEKLGELFAVSTGESEMPGALLVDIEKLQVAEQPRQHFDPAALQDLENSIRELHEARKGIGGTGILQPLLVRSAMTESGNNPREYIVTAGERRLRAAKAAGIKQVPIVLEESDTEEAWEYAIIENLLRADLAPLEEANAVQKLMHSRGYSVREAAKRLGKDKGYLENRLFLLKAPEDVQAMVSARADTIRHAREISKIAVPATRQKIIELALRGASFSVIQARVQNLLEPQEKTTNAGVNARPNAQANEKSVKPNVGSLSTVSAHTDTTVLDVLADTIQKVSQFAETLPAETAVREQFAANLRERITELESLVETI